MTDLAGFGLFCSDLKVRVYNNATLFDAKSLLGLFSA